MATYTTTYCNESRSGLAYLAASSDYTRFLSSKQEAAMYALANDGLLARLEAINAVVEPLREKLVITFPGCRRLELGYDVSGIISKVEYTLNFCVSRPVRLE